MCNTHWYIPSPLPQVVRMFIIVVTIFAICWLPYHLFFVYAYHNNQMTSSSYVQQLYLGFYWLAMSNAMVNPIIYYWMNSRSVYAGSVNFENFSNPKPRQFAFSWNYTPSTTSWNHQSTCQNPTNSGSTYLFPVAGSGCTSRKLSASAVCSSSTPAWRTGCPQECCSTKTPTPSLAGIGPVSIQ